MKQNSIKKRKLRVEVKPEAHKKSDYLEALLVQGLLVFAWLLITALFGFAKGEQEVVSMAFAWCGIGCVILCNAKRL